MIRAYHRARNDLERDEILVPDAAHGTNRHLLCSVGSKCVKFQLGPMVMSMSKP